jgi:hypothetical protein
MPSWRRVAVVGLIDVPAAIVTVWQRVYTVILAIVSLALWSVTLMALILWFGFGIRWGW